MLEALQEGFRHPLASNTITQGTYSMTLTKIVTAAALALVASASFADTFTAPIDLTNGNAVSAATISATTRTSSTP